MPENANFIKKTDKEKLRNILLNTADSVNVKVRFNDTDAMGIVHFKNYSVYFDDGFVSFMDNISPTKRTSDAVDNGIVFPVKHIDITYENSAKFGDSIIVETMIKSLGKTSITFNHKINKESDRILLAEVESVRLVMDLKTKKLMDIMEFFAEFLGFV
ncbi:MAG: acyl-CoA thioesterase [Promethearchaeota archaeon]